MQQPRDKQAMQQVVSYERRQVGVGACRRQARMHGEHKCVTECREIQRREGHRAVIIYVAVSAKTPPPPQASSEKMAYKTTSSVHHIACGVAHVPWLNGCIGEQVDETMHQCSPGNGES